MEHGKTPKIRFNGFNDNWEVRKLGEVVLIERGGSPRPIDAYITNDPQGLNWVKIGDAPRQGNYITQTEEKIIPQGLSKTREVKVGDLILSNSMSFGKPYIMAINGCIHDGWLLIRNTMNIFNLQFLCVLLGTDNMLNQYKSLAAGSTVNNLNKELVGNTQVSFPTHAEQERIGQYFSRLDDLINLYKRKLEKSLNFKKAMLAKMFPQNGKSTPQIRFAGFNDNWEVRKLGEVMNVTSVKRIHQSDWTNSGIRFLRARDIVAAAKGEEPSDYLYISKNKYDECTALSGKVSVNDILVTGVGTIGVPYLIINYEPLYFKDGNVIWFQNNEKINGKFFYFSFIGSYIQSFIQDSAGIGTVGTYTIETGKITPIQLPTHAEQERIGQYFSRLDDLINLYKRKLEKSLNLKKAMLEKMFP